MAVLFDASELLEAAVLIERSAGRGGREKKG